MTDRGRGLVVLGYHNVEPTACFPAPDGAGPRGLRRQLSALQKVATIVPLEDALQKMARGEPLPARAVAITFDDGYRDNLTVAGPILRDLGVPATCFLVPDILSGTVTPWWEELAWALMRSRAGAVDWHGRRIALTTPAERRAAFRQLAPEVKVLSGEKRAAAVARLVALADPPEPYRPERDFLDWAGAARLRQYMAIGSHSQRHTILAHEDAETQQADLAGARRELTERLDVEISVLAYPNGTRADYDDNTLRAAERAGYSFAVTTEPGRNTSATPRYEIRRSVLLPQRGPVELGKVVRDVALSRN
jgi:peptidoglycan/xylan/chitin deacetylase (PgdA/CDA1 family)